MIKERRKWIYLDDAHTKYCIVRLFATKRLMQSAYAKRTPYSEGHYKVSGSNVPYHCVRMKQDGSEETKGEIATVFLSVENCGAGVVAHELGHAALWGYKYHPGKVQFPIIFNSMEDEEEFLYSQTYAVMQFYRWYWKVVEEFPK